MPCWWRRGENRRRHSLQLQNAGVAVNGTRRIVVDDYLRTTADNIWAMGDVTGGLQFTYISLDDFRIVRDGLWEMANAVPAIARMFRIPSFMTPPPLSLVSG